MKENKVTTCSGLESLNVEPWNQNISTIHNVECTPSSSNTLNVDRVERDVLLPPRKGVKRKIIELCSDISKMLFTNEESVCEEHFNDTDYTEIGKLWCLYFIILFIICVFCFAIIVAFHVTEHSSVSAVNTTDEDFFSDDEDGDANVGIALDDEELNQDCISERERG